MNKQNIDSVGYTTGPVSYGGMDPREYKRRVVCAANRNALGHIVLGPRHFDETMVAQIHLYRNAGVDLGDEERFDEQGFIDQHGVFMTREEAWIVAEAADQIIRRVGGDMCHHGIGKLFSENLY